MTNELKEHISFLAEKYETSAFIPNDPISFPHRYSGKTNIEITGFVASWLSYGKRELFLKVLDNIGKDFAYSPIDYLLNREYKKYENNNQCLYRFYKKNDFYNLMHKLYKIYSNYVDMETFLNKCLLETDEKPSQHKEITLINIIAKEFSNVNGIVKNTTSACKKLCMFMRWMTRKNSSVDFGLWNILEAKDLIIPLDVHVMRQSQSLGLTFSSQTNMKTAIEITNNLKEVFPLDPTRADFALFGLGVSGD